MFNSIFGKPHERGILIKTYPFEDCEFPEFKLRYYEDCFILYKYFPEYDEWDKYCFIEVYRITESPLDWAERQIKEYRRGKQ